MGEFLVIDDDDDYGQFVVEGLRRLGYPAIAVTSVNAGLELLRARGFRGVVVDLLMPEMDGLEAVREVRRIRIDVPILLLTGGFGDSRPYLNLAQLLGADLTGGKGTSLQASLARLVSLAEERCPRARAC